MRVKLNNKTKKELQEKIKEQSEHINFLEHTIEYMYNDEQVIDLIVSWNCYKCMYFDCCGEQEIKHISPDISKFNFTVGLPFDSFNISKSFHS